MLDNVESLLNAQPRKLRSFLPPSQPPPSHTRNKTNKDNKIEIQQQLQQQQNDSINSLLTPNLKTDSINSFQKLDQYFGNIIKASDPTTLQIHQLLVQMQNQSHLSQQQQLLQQPQQPPQQPSQQSNNDINNNISIVPLSTAAPEREKETIQDTSPQPEVKKDTEMEQSNTTPLLNQAEVEIEEEELPQSDKKDAIKEGRASGIQSSVSTSTPVLHPIVKPVSFKHLCYYCNNTIYLIINI